MTHTTTYATRALALIGVFLSAGCTTFQDFIESRPFSRQPPPVPLAERARLDPIDANLFVLTDEQQSVIGVPQIVFTNEEDTLSTIAREYGLGYDEIVAANPGVDPWLPGDATPILLPTQYVLPAAPREGIVLNIASTRLFYFPPVGEDGIRRVMTFPIGIGRVGWETPLGDATVVSKARDPHWWVPASVRKEHEELGDPLPAVVPPGPENPLGRYVLKLDMPGYLIHGTNMPWGVGMRVSHGCVRLYPENIETLYPLIAIGAPVTIVNQPYLAGWHHGELYFEGHVPLEDDEVTPQEHLDVLMAGFSDRLDGRALEKARLNAAAIASAGSGIPVRALRSDVDEVYERARVVANTVEPDPDVPTLAEVRELLDQPADDPQQAAGEAAADTADAGSGNE
ncbi:MAG: L,D-transpeptidase family protein [Woeseiaceae bacterium]|nr:L,D-transpeptidase family protein [Woeseiaceae bacterium]